MKARSNFLEQLQRRRERAASEATGEASGATPETPEPTEPLPSDPEARAALLSDELSDTRQALEAERKARRQAEQRVEQQNKPGTLADVLHDKQLRKRRTWR